jgi:hypothetical protein
MSASDWMDYYAVAMSVPALVDEIEFALRRLEENAPFTLRELAGAMQPGFAYDHIVAVVGALQQLGVLQEHSDGAFVVHHDCGPASNERAAARAALQWMARRLTADATELLVASPRIGKAQAGFAYERGFSDLRTTARTLFASARHSLLAASPYWDVDVAADLSSLFVKRLADGVHIRILARRPSGGSQSESALKLLQREVGSSTGCQIRILDEPSASDPFGRATFHFKVACADEETAYLGSANFNTAGMNSRWELGVLLRGQHARSVSALTGALFQAAQPYRATH